jgi:NAD(P)H-dependent FMN reductase
MPRSYNPWPVPTLIVIIASTRPGRVGLPVAEWFLAHAREHGHFDLDVVDLAGLGLPFLDEPNHPKLRNYTQDHTRRWSARVDAADAFVFVTPEYNLGFNAPLKNAIDFLHHEWKHKPVGFVSYGGVSAGSRAVAMLKTVVSGVSLVPASATVSIPFVRQFLEDGVLQPNDAMEEAAPALLDDLARLEHALRELRVPAEGVAET